MTNEAGRKLKHFQISCAYLYIFQPLHILFSYIFMRKCTNLINSCELIIVIFEVRFSLVAYESTYYVKKQLSSFDQPVLRV